MASRNVFTRRWMSLRLGFQLSLLPTPILLSQVLADGFAQIMLRRDSRSDVITALVRAVAVLGSIVLAFSF